MILPDISTEQNNIIEQLLLNNNVVVNSVAGSGKTTTNLHIGQYFNNINILLLTYNSKLKLETREKAKILKINNIEVHSYHSFCVKYYERLCFTDTIINKIIKNKNKPIKEFNYDLIVLDEAQDITSLYYELICKIYKDNNNINTKICIFGDIKQSIFDFNKADQRFIEYASDLFNFNSYKWIKCNLSVSFRITYEMSLFINRCLLKEERIISNKISNNQPRYIICDAFGDDSRSRSFDEVQYYFSLGYEPNDIFILAPSIKGIKSPIRQLENKIKTELHNVMVYVPNNDDEKLDEELLEGKIIFSTFHQTKGLERKVIIIFNFDNSYFEYYKKDSNPFICSNELYVATTRGIERLTLLHHYNNEYLNFIDEDIIQQYCYFEKSKLIKPSKKNMKKDIDTSITEINKHLHMSVIDKCINELEIIQNSNYKISKINIPLKISNNITTESISDITGIAIPCMFELKLNNKMTIYETLINNDYGKIEKYKINEKYIFNNIDINNIKIDELLYISNCWNTFKNGFLFKIYQITNYDWLEKQKLDECVNRLDNLNISNGSLFEYKLDKNTILNRKLIGYIDCIDIKNDIMYEFKCVQKIEKEHYLQLAIYMYMYEDKKRNNITDKFSKEINKIKQEIKINEQKILDIDKLDYIVNLLNTIDIINKKIKKNINQDEINLLHIKERLNKKISIYENKLLEYGDCKKTIYEKTNEYIVGNIVKYKSLCDSNENIGKIIRIYKRTEKIKIKNSDNKNIDIPKTNILSIQKNTFLSKEQIELENTIDNLINELNTVNCQINDIKQQETYNVEINKLNNELKNINDLIIEKRNTEINNIQLKNNQLNEDMNNLTIKYNEDMISKNNTKYVLFNILTNEYFTVKCEFEKLKKMIEYLIYSKYVNNKAIPDEEFIYENKNIYKLYFE